MAKSEAQQISMTQAYVSLWRNLIDYLEGAFEYDTEVLDDEIPLGGSEDETILQQRGLANLRSAASAFYASAQAFLTTLAPSLGRPNGCPNPLGSNDANLAYLNDAMVTASREVLSRGFTKSVWTADGGNTGTGRIVRILTDTEGEDADCAHPMSSMRLRCMRQAGLGVREGEEPFELTGTAQGRSWEDDGWGTLYQPPLGHGINEFSRNQLRPAGFGPEVEAFRSMSGASSQNGVTNGSVEGAVTGTGVDKFPGITFISGETNASVESTAPLVGDQSMKIDGNCVFYMLLKDAMYVPKTGLAFGALVKKVIASSTLTGTLTIILRSGGNKAVAAQGTAHKTITVTIGSLTNNVTTNADEAIILPTVLGDDLRLEFTVTSYTDGSGTDNSLLIDEIYAGRMYQIDMGQQILAVRGVAPWEEDDRFTASVTDLEGGEIQEFMNRTFGRYLRHAATADTWVDPTLAPEIVATGSVDGSTFAAHADGDEIDHGTDTSGAHLFYVKFSNTGNFPLSIGIPTESGATNCSITNTPMAVPLVVMPGRSRIITVEVTDGGAGAYDITLTFATNDSSEATYEVDFIGEAS